MKIMIFTDNLYMYQNFIEIIEQKNLNKLHNFEYACSPSNSLFEKIDNVKELNIKDKANDLVNKFDLIISCHSKQIFPPVLVNNIRCINIHPGLNPYNRGWYPQVFSIINKMPLGATIHEMDEEVDHGAIIVQKEIELYSWDTSLTAYNRVIEAEIELLNKSIESIIDRTYNTVSMEHEGNYNSKQDFNELCELKLAEKMTVEEIIDKLRALTHGEYSNAFFVDSDGTKVYVSIGLSVLLSKDNNKDMN